MSKLPDAIWLSSSPSLQFLDRPLLKFLGCHARIARWQYYQDQDEGSSLDTAIDLLHAYLCDRPSPVHLMGHGLSGVIGLLYARRYPEKVRSLTLLSVAAQPAKTWQAHYYVQRHLLPCSRQHVLATIVTTLFGAHLPYPPKDLIEALSRDLEESPCLHSLFSLVKLPVGGVKPPLLVCGSQTDAVIPASSLNAWYPWLKPGDAIWDCPEGRHFFHYFNPHLVGDRIIKFWQEEIPAQDPSELSMENYQRAHRAKINLSI